MGKPVLLAAVATVAVALPVGAFSQEDGAGSAPPHPDCAVRAEEPRADSALPARASTKPEPQLGSVAPGTRVPSHTATPSSRAMAAASAGAGKKKEKNPTDGCPGAATSPPVEDGGAQPKVF